MRPWLIGLLLLATAGTLSPATAQDAGARLLERAAEIERRGPALAEIWPGYWPPGQPFVIYLPGVGAAFGGSLGEDGPVFRPGALDDVRFAYVIDYASGVENTILQRIETVEESLDTLFHEQFHDYQSAAFVSRQGAVGEFVDLSAVADLTDFVVGIELERRLLATALAAPDDEARRVAARQFVTARKARLSAAPSHIRVAEDHFEWNEGTARYAEVMAMTVLEPEGSDTAGLIGETLAEPLSRQGVGLMSSLFRWRAYGVGAAQAWLLDALDAPDWRQEVERGAHLADLLEARLDVTGPAAAIAPAPSPELETEVRMMLAEHPADPADATAFLASRPHWLEVVLDAPASRAAELNFSFSASFTPFPDGRLALQNARSVLLELDGFRLEAGDRAALIEFGGDPDRSRTRVHVAVTAEEAEALSTGGAHVALTGLNLTIPPGAVVESSPGQRVVRLDP